MASLKKVVNNVKKAATKVVDDVKDTDWEKVGKKVEKAANDFKGFVEDAADDVKDVADKAAMYGERLVKSDSKQVKECYVELLKNDFTLNDKAGKAVPLEQVAGLDFGFSDESTDLAYCINQFKINDYQVLHTLPTPVQEEL